VDARARKLLRILRRNERTAYGLAHDFAAIDSVAEFQARVPVTTYEDYIPAIEAIRRGEPGVLTSEPVRLLHPTSGSTTARKLIPYTDSLRREFAGALRAWLSDLAAHFPGLKDGQAYFSLTPAGAPEEVTPGGVRIGFAEDTDYLGPSLGRAVAARLVWPRGLTPGMPMDDFWDATVEALRRASDIRFVSVWSPTFLLLLLDHARQPANRLLPRLEVVSCWADGNSRPSADALRKAFPGVYVQPKGLLATEGVVTIPLEGVGKRLTTAHFFEFRTPDGEMRLPGELRPGDTGEVVMTTSGGLYRYALGDVVHYRGECCFDFIGRAGVSDQCGEKLNEVHVGRVVGADRGFRLLAPEPGGYVLYTDTPLVAARIDEGLRENFHYDHCRALGQLRQVRVVVVEDGARQYVDNCLRFGQRLGDIKPLCLSPRQGWEFR